MYSLYIDFKNCKLNNCKRKCAELSESCQIYGVFHYEGHFSEVQRFLMCSFLNELTKKPACSPFAARNPQDSVCWWVTFSVFCRIDHNRNKIKTVSAPPKGCFSVVCYVRGGSRLHLCGEDLELVAQRQVFVYQ